MAWHGMAWHGMAWHGMAWHGMAWHGMAWRRRKPQQMLSRSAQRKPNCMSKPRIFLQHCETGLHSALVQPGPYPSPVAWPQALRSAIELCKGAVYLQAL